MVTRKIILGSKELKLLFTLEKEKKNIFRNNDAKRIIQSSNSSIRNILYRLNKKNRIERIEKGKYLLIPAKAGIEGLWSESSFLIVNGIIDYYYIGFWSALNYWGMTEQVPRTLYIVTNKRKDNFEYDSTRFKFITLSNNKFIDIIENKIDNSTFKISTKEKTIVDCLMYPEYCGGLDEIVKAIWNERKYLDFKKIIELGKQIGISTINRRLACILEILDIEERARSEISSLKFSGYQWFDPLAPKNVKNSNINSKYKIIMNRKTNDLLEMMMH